MKNSILLLSLLLLSCCLLACSTDRGGRGDDDDDAANDDDSAADDDDVSNDDDQADDDDQTDDDDQADDDDTGPAELEGDEPGECDDGYDNDDDGAIDCDDEDCQFDPACLENKTPEECDDGFDNDDDGATDCDDTDCSSAPPCIGDDDDDTPSPPGALPATGDVPCGGSAGPKDVYLVDFVVPGTYTITVDTVSAATTFDPYAYATTDTATYLVASKVGYDDDSLTCSYPPPQYGCPQFDVSIALPETLAIVVWGYTSNCNGSGVGSYELSISGMTSYDQLFDDITF